MSDATPIHSFEELALWAEDQGALDDSILLAWQLEPPSLTVALSIIEDAPADRRDAYRRTSERYLTFTLLLTREGQMSVNGGLEANEAFEYELVQEEGVFGLELRFGDAVLRAVAAEWSVAPGVEIVLPIEPWLDTSELTFHGPGPIAASAFHAALVESGAPSDLYGNWKGSGQAFGAAFVREISAAEAVTEDALLSGAWRVVPEGAEAADARGLWVSGNSRSGYATLQRGPDTDRKLVRAVAQALAALPGLTWAVSGNTLVEDAAAREAWWSAAYAKDN